MAKIKNKSTQAITKLSQNNVYYFIKKINFEKIFNSDLSNILKKKFKFFFSSKKSINSVLRDNTEKQKLKSKFCLKKRLPKVNKEDAKCNINQ